MAAIRYDEAERLGPVLEVLAQCLDPSTAHALAQALPPTLARSLRGIHAVGAFELDELVLRVAGRVELTRASAAALVDAAFSRVAHELTPAALRMLRQGLPASIAAGFPTIEPEEEAAPIWHASSHRDTLAEGRPGSRHPLSEARPDRAHSQSVARSENPHGDDKLSSARGLTQEREEDSLATGRPGSRRPLSEG